MQTIKLVIGKELKRIFSDRKLVFSLYVMPIITVICIYGLMFFMGNMMSKDIEEHTSRIAICNVSEDLKAYLEENAMNYEMIYIDAEQLEGAKQDIYNGELDLLVSMPDNMDAMISNYQDGDEIPDIKTYYNPSEDYSTSAKEQFVGGTLSSYRTACLQERVGNLDTIEIFTIDKDNTESVIQDETKAGGKMLGMIIPYLISILLFAGAMSLGIDMIAGEKERGTLAAMLILPIKRGAIVYGKLISLMVLSGLSALVYGIAMMVAMPFMAGSAGEMLGISVHFSVVQIVMLLAMILSIVFLFVTLIAIAAVYAKTAKEASGYVSPVYLLVMISGMITMFTGTDAQLWHYVIPLYGGMVALKNVFTMDITTVQFLIAFCMNLLTGAVLASCVTKGFQSEKVMFDA